MSNGKNRLSVLRGLAVGIHILVTVLSVVVCAVGIYIRVQFPAEKLDELWFYLTGGVGEGGIGAVGSAAAVLVLPCLAVSALLLFLQYGFGRHPVGLRRRSKKTGEIRFFRILPVRPRWLFAAVSCLLLIGIGFWQVGAFSYLSSNSTPSGFIEGHYVSPQTPRRITSPEKKRNLVFIELESMETSFFSREHGGLYDTDIIPELYGLLSAPDAVYFATDAHTHGTLNAFGSTWTTAALVSYTAGLPLKVPVGKYNSYHSKSFLYGAWSLGDVLKANGYRNILVSGAETCFGGGEEYFSAHGDYDIVDVDSPRFTGADGKQLRFDVPESQRNEWGFSDEATLRIAKEVLQAQAQDGDTPWHLFVSTIDTHFTGYTYKEGNGYRGSETAYASKAENVYATTSREVGEFVAWLREQPFYENTTVVIVGDHPNMSKNVGNGIPADDRGRYNVILNSAVTAENTKNRQFTAFDFYPTVLAATGFRLATDYLALGVNLFSGLPTYAEKYGMEKLNAELEKYSDFYIDKIMGRGDYRDLGGETETAAVAESS